MPRSSGGPPAAIPASDAADRALASSALQKRARGESPNARELAALRRFERAREEQQRWEYYRAIPQKHWRAMSGRQAKVLNEQASTYGIPFAGATVDLPAVVLALHEFLRKNAHRLGRDASRGENEHPRDRLCRLKGDREQLGLERERGEWIAREDLHAALAIFADGIRSACEQLQREYGMEAQLILEEAFADAQRKLLDRFADNSPGDNGGPDDEARNQIVGKAADREEPAASLSNIAPGPESGR